MMDGNSDSFGGALVLRRPQKGRMVALRDEPSKVSFDPLCHTLSLSYADNMKTVTGSGEPLLCGGGVVFAAASAFVLSLLFHSHV